MKSRQTDAGEEIGLHLELIGEEMRPAEVERFAAADRFRAPLNGECILANGKVVCRYAYEKLVPTHVEAHAVAACYGLGQAGPTGAWMLEMPPRTRVDPVVNEAVPLQGHVCSGEPLIFTEYGSPRRFRLVLDVSGVRLMDYRTRD